MPVCRVLDYNNPQRCSETYWEKWYCVPQDNVGIGSRWYTTTWYGWTCNPAEPYCF